VQQGLGTSLITVAICAALSLGCAGMNADARLSLQQPADCATAQADIQTLEASRGNGWWRAGQGLQGIVPVTAVLSLLRDAYGKPYRSIDLDHWRVAFGSYNKKIDARVTELKNCGM
jgi:hypothetical protein